MRNVTKLQRKSKQIVYSTAYVEIRAFYEVMWKTTVQPDRPQTIIWCMQFASWIT